MVEKLVKSIANNSVVQMIVALTVVGCLSGVTLVFVYNYATPKIKVNVQAETEKAIKNIFPTVSRIEQEKDIYKALDDKGSLLGYAFTAEGNGYQGTIQLLVGVDSTLQKMTGIEVLESQETPGLGAEITGSNFKDQFKGLPLDHKIDYVKNQKPTEAYEIEAITGATISSRAVVNILNDKIDEIKKELK